MTSITLVRAGDAGKRAATAVSGAGRRVPVPLPLAAALGWMGAALAIYVVELAARGPFAGLPRAAIALLKIALIVGAGGIYVRVMRGAPSNLVLATGLAWLTFSIAADVVTGIRSMGGYQLLGDSLAPPSVRNLTMLVWLASPALFARRGVRDQPPGDVQPSR